MKCQSCGKGKASEYKAAGKIRLLLCNKCKTELLWELNDHSVAMIWVSPYDLESHDLIDESETASVTRQDIDAIVDFMQDSFWNNDYNGYGDMLKEGHDSLRESKEKERIEKMPRKELPLLINEELFPENRKLLEKRLKGEPCSSKA